MTTNPRGRDLVQQSAAATPAAKLPAIPPGSTPFERAVKETLDVRGGVTGNPWERWVTLRKLSELGLAGGLARSDLPTDQAGFPVWTARGKFELLSLLALATAIAAQLPTVAATGGTSTTGTDTVDPKAFADLQAQVQKLAAGVTPDQMNAAIAASAGTVTAALQAAIKALAASVGVSVAQLQEADARLAALVQNNVTVGVKQTTPAATWTVKHSMNRYPFVTVLNASNVPVYPDIVYTDANTVTITHGRAMTGTVLLK